MDIKQKIILVIGVLLILSTLFINQFILQLFSDDGTINSNDKLFLIWLYDILALIISIVIIYNRGEIRIILKTIFFIFIQIIVVLVLLEGSLRLYFTTLHYFNPVDMVFDQKIGWQNSPHISRIDDFKLHGIVNYSTQKYGFRKFGNTKSDDTKLLIIGDSFTMAGNINDGKTYYDYLLNNLSGIEMFTYGGGGYGSLQEYMILDKYFDEIKPDIVIWQFCDNDIINNDHDLESRSLIHGGLDPRPYYIENDIKILLPWRRHSNLYNLLNKLYIVKLTSLELKILQKDNLDTIENSITQNNPFYQRSVQTTDKIMKLVKDRIGNAPLITFNAKIQDDFPIWWSQVFEDISMKNNFTFISQIADSLISAKISGIKVDNSPDDAHWNQTGHTIVGKILFEYLINNKLIKSNN